jgi:hypothetical protein
MPRPAKVDRLVETYLKQPPWEMQDGYTRHIGSRSGRASRSNPGGIRGCRTRATIASFAGTGNPFSLGWLAPGERVVDVGCCGGFDSLIAAAAFGTLGINFRARKASSDQE